MAKHKEVHDLGYHDLTQLTREELYREVINNQYLAVDVLAKVDWIIGAFMSTLENNFHFGKQRMRKVLKGVADRFRIYSDWPGGGLDFYKYLEQFDYRLFYKGHHFLLQDLKADAYYDDLASDLEALAYKIKMGQELTDEDRKILGVVREMEDETQTDNN